MKSIKINKIRGSVIVAAAILVLLAAVPLTSKAETSVYLAGTPDMWPFEYYDEETGNYCGVLPDILEAAGAEAGIKICYIKPSQTDNRLTLAANLQVDAICTMGLSDRELEKAKLQKGISLAVYQSGNKELPVSLAYTKSMQDDVRVRLEQQLQQLDAAAVHSAYLKYTSAHSHEQADSLKYRYAAIGILMAGGSVILLLAMWSRSKRLQLKNVMFRDEITGYDNFAAWKRTYKKQIVAENYSLYAVLYLNPGMETISQIYGYDEMHEALTIISRICQEQLDEKKEAFSRFNQYDFVFFVRYHNGAALLKRTEAITEAIKAAFSRADKTYLLELHMGIYFLTSMDTMNKAIQLSEIAAEYAKLCDVGQVVYDLAIEEAAVSGYVKEHEAVWGLKNQEFVMYLQPVVDMKNGKICMAEAMVRWNSPTRGLLHPKNFMDVIKKKQIIDDMNLEIYRQGCEFLSMTDRRKDSLKLLFNFSMENIGDEQFVGRLLEIAKQYQIRMEHLVIQIDQIREMGYSGKYKEHIQMLREQGMDICITGAELDQVFLECGANIVKLRPELVQQLDSPEGQKLASNIIGLFQQMGLKIICAGIEQEAQRSFLYQQGCDLASGFYYYYPVEPVVFMDLMEL